MRDTAHNKINLSIGAFRDDGGLPVVLPSVREAEKRLAARGENMEYCPITGFPEFVDLTLRVAYGWGSAAVDAKRIAGVAALSGTGALRCVGEFLSKFWPEEPAGEDGAVAAKPAIYLPDKTWGNHKGIFADSGLEVRQYSYYDPVTCGFDFEAMCRDIESMPQGSPMLLHTCGHNPTGVDPTHDQWRRLSQLIKSKGHFPIFDMAYQGFATGDAERDAFSLRLFVEDGHSLACCQSYAKNMGLYGQRTGCVSVVGATAAEAAAVKSQLAKIARTLWSSPPVQGSRLVMEVLKDDELRKLWYGEMAMMADRIAAMRTTLRDELLRLGSKDPRNWSHLIDQIGMFCFTGLSPDQVKKITEQYHVYMLSNGRISIAGVNTKNVAYLARAIHECTKDDFEAAQRSRL